MPLALLQQHAFQRPVLPCALPSTLQRNSSVKKPHGSCTPLSEVSTAATASPNLAPVYTITGATASLMKRGPSCEREAVLCANPDSPIVRSRPKGGPLLGHYDHRIDLPFASPMRSRVIPPWSSEYSDACQARVQTEAAGAAREPCWETQVRQKSCDIDHVCRRGRGSSQTAHGDDVSDLLTASPSLPSNAFRPLRGSIAGCARKSFGFQTDAATPPCFENRPREGACTHQTTSWRSQGAAGVMHPCYSMGGEALRMEPLHRVGRMEETRQATSSHHNASPTRGSSISHESQRKDAFCWQSQLVPHIHTGDAKQDVPPTPAQSSAPGSIQAVERPRSPAEWRPTERVGSRRASSQRRPLPPQEAAYERPCDAASCRRVITTLQKCTAGDADAGPVPSPSCAENATSADRIRLFSGPLQQDFFSRAAGVASEPRHPSCPPGRGRRADRSIIHHQHASSSAPWDQARASSTSRKGLGQCSPLRENSGVHAEASSDACEHGRMPSAVGSVASRQRSSSSRASVCRASQSNEQRRAGVSAPQHTEAASLRVKGVAEDASSGQFMKKALSKDWLSSAASEASSSTSRCARSASPAQNWRNLGLFSDTDRCKKKVEQTVGDLSRPSSESRGRGRRTPNPDHDVSRSASRDRPHSRNHALGQALSGACEAAAPRQAWREEASKTDIASLCRSPYLPRQPTPARSPLRSGPDARSSCAKSEVATNSVAGSLFDEASSCASTAFTPMAHVPRRARQKSISSPQLGTRSTFPCHNPQRHVPAISSRPLDCLT